jgi:hypothetical protein
MTVNFSLLSVRRQLSYIHRILSIAAMVTSCGPTNQLFKSAVQISCSNQLFISAV